ncbi:hypothetical protein CYK37_04960 [Mesorhizobium loti]|nr:helix-turn-helix transcriptional regulator [Mesorhizobium loti]PLP60488.1 hypothetical protein CYK37_04960 [Mesorhizobium loti]
MNLKGIDLALDKVVEATFNPSLWQEVVDDIAQATGSHGVNIIPVAERAPGLIVSTESLGGAFEDYFDDGWHTKEWRLRGVPFLLRQGTACDPQYTSRDDFEHNPYYRFHAKHGIGRSCMVAFSKPEEMLVMTLHRKLTDDFFSEEEVSVLSAMRDRLTMASTLMRSAMQHRVAGMMDAFEMADVAAIFFDRLGKVTNANGAATRLLGAELQVSKGELRSRRSEETRRIRERMHAVLSELWLRPDSTEGPILITREGRRPLAMRIQRLGGSLPDFFSPSVGVCLLEDPERRSTAEPQLLRQAFGLTRAEAEIAVLLSQGMRLRQIAEQKAISYETARAHLRSIFAKTGASRQADLIVLTGNLGNVG